MTENKNPKMGRPPVGKESAKTVLLQFRLSHPESEAIAKAAAKAGIKKPAIWARNIVLEAASKR